MGSINFLSKRTTKRHKNKNSFCLLKIRDSQNAPALFMVNVSKGQIIKIKKNFRGFVVFLIIDTRFIFGGQTKFL